MPSQPASSSSRACRIAPRAEATPVFQSCIEFPPCPYGRRGSPEEQAPRRTDPAIAPVPRRAHRGGEHPAIGLSDCRRLLGRAAGRRGGGGGGAVVSRDVP